MPAAALHNVSCSMAQQASRQKHGQGVCLVTVCWKACLSFPPSLCWLHFTPCSVTWVMSARCCCAVRAVQDHQADYRGPEGSWL